MRATWCTPRAEDPGRSGRRCFALISSRCLVAASRSAPRSPAFSCTLSAMDPPNHVCEGYATASASSVAGLHAVQPAAAFGWHQRSVQHGALDSAAEGVDDARYDESARGVGHEDDAVVDIGHLDVGDRRGDLVLHGDGGEVGGVLAT